VENVYPEYLRHSQDAVFEVFLYDDLIQVNVFPGLLEEYHVERIITRLSGLSGGKQYPVLVLPSAETRINFFALRMLASPAAMSYAKGTAYVIRSTHQQLMGETFFRLYQPSRPVRIFKHQPEALQWLEQGLSNS
jgi:hypothetical protein